MQKIALWPLFVPVMITYDGGGGTEPAKTTPTMPITPRPLRFLGAQLWPLLPKPAPEMLLALDKPTFLETNRS